LTHEEHFQKRYLRDAYGDFWLKQWKQADPWWWDRLLEAEHGDMLVSRNKEVAQFVLADPLMLAYVDMKVWGECPPTSLFAPSPLLKLEGYWFMNADKLFYSDGTAQFADDWRRQTSDLFKTGLHPNDLIWVDFMWANAFYNRHDQTVDMRKYWWFLNLGRPSHLAQHAATALDIAALGLSIGQTATIDSIGAALIGGGLFHFGPPGAVAGASVAAVVDVVISAPVGWADAAIGIGSLAWTGLSDYLGGYSSINDDRWLIGQATVHTSGVLWKGLTPETHYQLYANYKQVVYDFGSNGFDYKPIYWR